MTKDIYQCRIQEWSYWYGSIVSKALDSFRFPQSSIQRPEFSVESPASRVQSSASRVQSSASRVQRPVSRVQRPESRVQSPASRVQRPTLASKVQEFRYANLILFRNSIRSTKALKLFRNEVTSWKMWNFWQVKNWSDFRHAVFSKRLSGFIFQKTLNLLYLAFTF